jgi:hypothetical protein
MPFACPWLVLAAAAITYAQQSEALKTHRSWVQLYRMVRAAIASAQRHPPRAWRRSRSGGSWPQARLTGPGGGEIGCDYAGGRNPRSLATARRLAIHELNGLRSSLSFLFCHPKPETARLVLIDELNAGLFERCLNFQQS